jgi:hypothetical protein
MEADKGKTEAVPFYTFPIKKWRRKDGFEQ